MRRHIVKYLLLGLFSLSAAVAYGAQNEAEAGAQRIIKRIVAYHPQTEEGTATPVIKESRELNRNGQVTSIKRYFSNGNLKEEWQITYGKKGEMKEIHSWSYAKGYHEILQRFQFRRGKKITATFFYRNGFLEEETHIVYRKKRPSTQYVYNGFGKLKGEREVSYDGKEILILRPQDEPFEGKIETEYYE